jgi:hypothetical protein
MPAAILFRSDSPVISPGDSPLFISALEPLEWLKRIFEFDQNAAVNA